ncbi:DUF6318 family protein [Aeromicrobium duanguangcaii]|uniref:DUF6318 family protein n=1 Tax=Aeromicrobium duanguangcaii TaxID=2968086 RepID=A0ABY5KF63_9ACTN|nr:DUF6318 family protein [Aeromicrobium duanguangcaii]MCD9154984.1 DUF6318 family protein [Aeromicrobium duanguangcaii]MCL3838975.1 DUF6318 family protein [Aeromicrobium duanguangcaii]UUI67611.1 DUF6318 family protein [Aeromicrobium duanguangcaii]
MRRLLTAAAVVVLGLGTAACGGGEDDPAPPRASASASASATATTEPSWAPDAKPQRPADEKTDAGAQAFAEFAADTVFYMMATSDVPAMASIADLNTCDTCRSWDQNYTDGKINKQSILSGPVTYRPAGKPTVNDDVYYQVKLSMDVPKGKSVVEEPDGSKKAETIKAAKNLPFVADLRWKDDQWQLMRYSLG